MAGQGPNDILTKTFVAGGTINKHNIVKFGSADDTVVESTAVGDALIGVALDDATTGQRVDVQLMGIAKVKSGGTITRGGMVTTDNAGLGVAAAPAAGVNNSVIGKAMASAASGDIFPVLLLPDIIQGA